MMPYKFSGGVLVYKDTRVGRLWVDARGMAIGAGTSEVMVHIAGPILPKLYKNNKQEE